ncbi:outer membrane biogenesis protein BamB [Thalassoglobus neptunius]|uniref:Outer membrane biogenesis protein BamB n=1 Tax=Thalassoglobus neptunius TaxID=1938619 RepID=A0A5C5X818_9PLAN|nr:PQQ-binding-like beta-propeller repeat protein [Thalassoglobus neptunius]TWT59060.1 outer membrane biogenesis protein BamB [Thalassoglobus neptunius]
MVSLFVFLVSLSILVSTGVGDDWPQWGGPQRDAVWRESGIVESLPAGLLPRVWSTPIEEGYSGPAVADGRVFVTDRIHGAGTNGTERILALDAETGEMLWKHEYPCLYDISYPAGPRATPVVDGDRVYTIGAVGNFLCLNVSTGDVIWSRDFQKDFGVRLPTWGMAASPLVDGDQLITLVGAKDGLVISFNKYSGEVIWRALDDPAIGYSPPVIHDFNGHRLLIQWHPKAISALRPETGEVVWEVPFAVRSGLTAPMARQHGQRVFVTAFYNGPLMIEVAEDGSNAKVLWRGESDSEIKTDKLHSIISTPWFEDDLIFGVDSYGQLRGLDAGTGERLWETREATGDGRWWNAFLIPHEDRFFIHNEQGELIVASLGADGYTEHSRALLVEPTRKVQRRMTIWSHPAFAMKSVFARNDKEIVRVDLSR